MTKGSGRNGEIRKIGVNDSVWKLLMAINTKYEDKVRELWGLLERIVFTEEKSSVNLLSTSSPRLCYIRLTGSRSRTICGVFR